MSGEPFEAMPDVMDAKQLTEALQISKAGAYNLLSSPDFPTLRIGGCKNDGEQGGLIFEIEKGRLSFRLTAPYSEERCKAASWTGCGSAWRKFIRRKSKMDMTPQTWPEWYDGRHINEVLFCQQFLEKHPTGISTIR